MSCGSGSVPGLLTSLTDPRGVVTSRSYDGNNLCLPGKVDSSNHSEKRTWSYLNDSCTGLLRIAQDVDNSATVTNTYDDLGRPTGSVAPDRTVSIFYSPSPPRLASTFTIKYMR